jgi:hypothetical protein
MLVKSLLVCFVLAMSFTSSAQKIRFSDTTNKWVYIKPNDCSTPILFDYFSFSYNGDTVVNGITYQKLYETTPSSLFISPFLLGLIREDTTARKVYIMYPAVHVAQNLVADTFEHILFDYTLSIGDTIKFDHYDTITNALIQGRSVLASIDSVLINGTWHVRQKFSPNSSYPWANGYDVIEGLGGKYFNPIAPVFAAGECSPTVMCFRHRGVLPPMNNIIFQNNTSCHLAVQQLDTENEKILVIPNPFTTSAKVRLPYAVTKGRATIYSHIGQVVYTRKVSQQSEIDIDGFDHPSGLYILDVYDEIEQRRSFIKVAVDK